MATNRPDIPESNLVIRKRSKNNKTVQQNKPSNIELDWDTVCEDELRVVLIGITGSGKSRTGNTILGRNAFNSQFGKESTTTICQCDTIMRSNKTIVVVDTPGVFDTRYDNEKTLTELARCVAMADPGPHAFLMLMQYNTKYTDQEAETIRILKQFFGKDVMRYVIIVFTHRDQLEIHGETEASYVKGMPEGVQRLLKECDQRYIGFNNAPNANDPVQVDRLMDMVSNLKERNGGHFSNQMTIAVSSVIRDRANKSYREYLEQDKTLPGNRGNAGIQAEVRADIRASLNIYCPIELLMNVIDIVTAWVSKVFNSCCIL